ncbi:hypothetical protein O159_03600 [Leifsonia xyli subsp. cynodontis DSM 46306]|jgi:hypothetical protein|uniref:Uncharacterized protein n=1 Tax=Leifsonia xyli subsp. cynodontis DSM 46306 TaxID=1389489 RepID=U3P2N2_LEIXC|nr:hypothetical protein [Leifsonia xyli]AGW40575.1 hypothetical protein O159_03600 [Leifsonia xyli subsp. cynodontis DSM 46306]
MQNRGFNGQRALAPPGPATMAAAARSDGAAPPPSTREVTQRVTLVGTGTVPTHDSVVAFERVTSGGHVIDAGITDPVFDRDGAFRLSSSLELREGATYHHYNPLDRAVSGARGRPEPELRGRYSGREAAGADRKPRFRRSHLLLPPPGDN